MRARVGMPAIRSMSEAKPIAVIPVFRRHAKVLSEKSLIQRAMVLRINNMRNAESLILSAF
ncbi:hypothetical protein BVI434_1620005 [Burkholderia vietnamiensis]|nr:hypothetical protein BVI434_1620005 [Burkholderia vietnamiensis]